MDHDRGKKSAELRGIETHDLARRLFGEGAKSELRAGCVVVEDNVSSHAAVLARAEYSKPSVLLSDYPGHIVEERAEGMFH